MVILNGLLEALLLSASKGNLNLYGVEVPSCVNKYLPETRLLRVPGTSSVHEHVVLATTLLFV